MIQATLAISDFMLILLATALWLIAAAALAIALVAAIAFAAFMAARAIVRRRRGG